MYPLGEPKKIMAARDPILITDTQGKIIFYNPYAICFPELHGEEILMDSWREVMMIVNDHTNEEVEDPVPEGDRQRLVVTYEFTTAVVTKSGKGHTVGVIVRPVKNDQHDLIGVFIHIQKKTLDQIRMA